jgi:hypothetical protein
MSVEGVVLFVIDNRRVSRRLKLAFRRDVRTVKQGLTRGDKLAGLYSIRQACPECGRPMRVLPDEPARGPLRYTCAKCDDDPLRDPTARNWADGPLRPPEK